MIYLDSDLTIAEAHSAALLIGCILRADGKGNIVMTPRRSRNEHRNNIVNFRHLPPEPKHWTGGVE